MKRLYLDFRRAPGTSPLGYAVLATGLLCAGLAVAAPEAESARAAPAGAPASPGPGFPKEGISLEEVERNYLLQALESAGWNITQAARLLGLSRDTLRYRIEKYGLRPSSDGTQTTSG